MSQATADPSPAEPAANRRAPMDVRPGGSDNRRRPKLANVAPHRSAKSRFKGHRAHGDVTRSLPGRPTPGAGRLEHILYTLYSPDKRPRASHTECHCETAKPNQCRAPHTDRYCRLPGQQSETIMHPYPPDRKLPLSASLKDLATWHR